jgi:WhiB family transcriptional regulator, redox-sensing transcriptional regulator
VSVRQDQRSNRAARVNTTMGTGRTGTILVAEPWTDLALCAQADPEAWFPEKGGSTRLPKLICRGCEVRGECLDYALETDQRFGVWGGLSERERRQLKREAS